jgi:hypothetical protein
MKGNRTILLKRGKNERTLEELSECKAGYWMCKSQSEEFSILVNARGFISEIRSLRVSASLNTFCDGKHEV